MKILVIGKNGQLGKSIHKVVSNSEQIDDDFVFVGRDELDLNKEKSIASYFNNNSFDVIVNCAAYTAVDQAESEQKAANQVNHLAVKQLAEIASKQKAKLVHISTDYVFDGKSEKSYIETDETNPINVYGKTKLAGETAIQKYMSTNAVIIRASWVYSEYGNNFVDTMLRLGKQKNELTIVSDQIGSPTYATDLAKVILKVIKSKSFQAKNNTTEVYHYSNKGEISWYEFAKAIFKVANIECKVHPIATEQYPTPAKRPKNTLMSKGKITKAFNDKSADWVKSLQICIKNIRDK